MTLTRKVLFESIYDLDFDPKISPRDSRFLRFAQNFILNHYCVHSTELVGDFDAYVRTLKKRAVERMGNCGFPAFIKANETWLNTTIPRPPTKDPSPVNSTYQPTGRRPGRPSKSFTESEKSARYAKAKKAADDNDLPFLFEVLRTKLKQSGSKEASKVVQFLSGDPDINGKRALNALSVKGISLNYV